MSKINLILVARLTIGEALRRRILLAGFGVTVVFLALYGTGAYFAFRDIRSSAGSSLTSGAFTSGDQFLAIQSALFLAMGLFVASMVGALVAAFTAVGTISSEVEQGILQTIVTRPVTRRDVILGKFLGHGLLLSLYLGVFFLALVGIVYSQGGWRPDNLPLTAAVVVLQSLVILAAAMLGSTLFSAATNGVVVLLLYGTALIGGFLEQAGAVLSNEILFQIGIASGLLMPTDSLYRYAVQLLQGDLSALGTVAMGPMGSASPPSVWVLVYALFFVAAVLCAATATFSRRDL